MPNLNNVSSPSLWQRIWQGFLTTVGTKQFFRLFAPWVKWLSILAGICLLIGSVWGLAFAPPDYLQGNSYRIIFIHVPAASLAISIYFALAVLGVIYLVWKIKTAAILSIIGAVNLPIIKYSVAWWNTLHQGATFTLTEAPKMSADMWMPLLMMIIGSYLLVAALAIYRTNTLILYRDQGKAWVKEYIRAQNK